MRKVVKFLLSLGVGVAILWLGFWWYAEHRLQSGFQAWAEQQATNGWKITYDSIQRATSPINAAITVDQLTLTPPPGPHGETIAISFPTAGLRIAALDPLVFHIDLPAQIGVTIGDAFGVAIDTGRISLSENLNPDNLFNPKAYPFNGGDFSAGDIHILASGLEVMHIASITAHTDLNLDAGADGTAISATTALDGLAISPLLARIESVPFGGKLAHLAFAWTLSGPVPNGVADLAARLNATGDDRAAAEKLVIPLVHEWASQGGKGDASVQLVVDASTMKATASLGFDGNLQPAGTADLNADHLGQFTNALTNAYPSLADDVAQTEARLSPYMANTVQNGQTLAMHIIYGSSAITINGRNIAPLPQVDWSATGAATP